MQTSHVSRTLDQVSVLRLVAALGTVTSVVWLITQN
jgi:hypothetical protein